MGYCYDIDNPELPRNRRMKRRFRRKFIRAQRWRDGGTWLCKFSSLFFVLGALVGLVLFLNIMDTDDKLKYVALDRSKHMIAFVAVIALNLVGLFVVFVGRFLYWKGSSHLQTFKFYVNTPIAALATFPISAYSLNNRNSNRSRSSHHRPFGFYRH